MGRLQRRRVGVGGQQIEGKSVLQGRLPDRLPGRLVVGRALQVIPACVQQGVSSFSVQ